MDSTVVEMLARNGEHAAEDHGRFDDLQDAQFPEAVTVCCSDSRVLQDEMWGNDEPGKIFTVGNIGNRVTQQANAGEVVSGDVLYPIANTGTEVAVVVGHTGCGAVTAAYSYLDGTIDQPPGVAYCVERLQPHVEAALDSLPEGLTEAETVNHLVEHNVDHQVESLLESDDVSEDVTVVGVVYDFQDVYSDRRGKVHVINVQGETDVSTLREEYPDIASHVDRLWG